ncbi:hypothetical protein pb186bvf_002716 [Paramecium bursaria]
MIYLVKHYNYIQIIQSSQLIVVLLYNFRNCFNQIDDLMSQKYMMISIDSMLFLRWYVYDYQNHHEYTIWGLLLMISIDNRKILQLQITEFGIKYLNQSIICFPEEKLITTKCVMFDKYKQNFLLQDQYIKENIYDFQYILSRKSFL